MVTTSPGCTDAGVNDDTLISSAKVMEDAETMVSPLLVTRQSLPGTLWSGMVTSISCEFFTWKSALMNVVDGVSFWLPSGKSTSLTLFSCVPVRRMVAPRVTGIGPKARMFTPPLP